MDWVIWIWPTRATCGDPLSCNSGITGVGRLTSRDVSTAAFGAMYPQYAGVHSWVLSADRERGQEGEAGAVGDVGGVSDLIQVLPPVLLMGEKDSSRFGPEQRDGHDPLQEYPSPSWLCEATARSRAAVPGVRPSLPEVPRTAEADPVGSARRDCTIGTRGAIVLDVTDRAIYTRSRRGSPACPAATGRTARGG
jgi:hypothetical protein